MLKKVELMKRLGHYGKNNAQKMIKVVRRFIFVCTLLLFFCCKIYAQRDSVAFVIGEQNACIGDTVTIAITVENFDSVFAASLAVNWNPDELFFLNETHDSLFSDQDIRVIDNERLKLVWFDFNSGSTFFSRSDGDTIIALNFLILQSKLAGTEIRFDPLEDHGVGIPDENGGTDFLIAQTIDGLIAFTNSINVQADATKITCSNPISNLSASSQRVGTRYSWFVEDSILWDIGQFTTTNRGGAYKVLAVNGNCIDSTTFLVEYDTLAPSKIQIVSDTITCQNAIIELSINSDNNELDYQWENSNGTTFTGRSINVQDTGLYFLQTTNRLNGCIRLDSTRVFAELNFPMVNIDSSGALNCRDNSVLLRVAPNDSSFLVRWQSEGNVLSSVDSIVINQARTITLEVENPKNNCVIQRRIVIQQDTVRPNVIIQGAQHLNCETKSVELSSINIPDNLRLNWLNESFDTLSTSSILSVSQAGTFTLSAFNPQNYCSDTASIQIEAFFETPNLSIDLSADTLNCSVSIIEASTVADSLTQLQWLTSNGTLMNSASSVQIQNPGAYQLVAINLESTCMDTIEFLIEQDVELPTFDVLGVDTITCNKPVLNLEIIPQESNDIASWPGLSNTATLQIDTAIQILAQVISAKNQCLKDTLFTIITDKASPNVAINTPDGVNLNCRDTLLRLQAALLEDSQPLNYNWITPSGTQLDKNIIVETIGTYFLEGENPINGCSSQANILIRKDTNPPNLVPKPLETLTCNVKSINLNNWTNLDDELVSWISPNKMILMEPIARQEGWYTFEAQNPINFCFQIDSVWISQDTTLPELHILGDSILTCSNDSLTLLAEVSTNVQTRWEDSKNNLLSNQSSLGVSETGTYTVYATGINGCQNKRQITLVEDKNFPNISLSVNQDFNCVNNEAILSVETEIPENILWSLDGVDIFNPNTPLLITGEPGLFQVSIRDSLTGCVSADSLLLRKSLLSLNNVDFAIVNPGCDTSNLGILFIRQITGGKEPYLFALNNGTLESSNTFSSLPAAQYNLTIEDADGCRLDTLITIEQADDFSVNIIPQRSSVNFGEELVLDYKLSSDFQSNVKKIKWFRNDTLLCEDCEAINERIIREVSYAIEVESDQGCFASSKIIIQPSKFRRIYIPSAFSPNGDEVNDELEIGTGMAVYSIDLIEVFDRYGSKVYQRKGFFNQSNWDGTYRGSDLPIGTYLVKVVATFIDGKQKTFTQACQLIR